MIDRSVWDVFAEAAIAAPVGVYFYDGGHTYQEQVRAIVEIEPFLADDAVVIVDDTAWSHVFRANADAIRFRPQFQLVAEFESPYNGEPRWWNGVQIFTYHRADTPTGFDRWVKQLRSRASRTVRRTAKRGLGLGRWLRRLPARASNRPRA